MKGKITREEIDQSLVTEINEINSQLDTIKNKTKKIISIDDFPKLGNELDDSERLQRAINSFKDNIGGTIIIPYPIYISKQITINKTGIKLKGLGNKISKIISSFSGISIYVKTLYNGNPYTNTGYCKFYIEDLSIQATGNAIDTGTGLYMQWIYSSLFTNLYTSGFRKHIVLKGAHLNTFLNLYQENSDSSELGLEIHNRGVSLSAEIDENEGTSNNNTIIGGWFHNTTLDLENLSYTSINNIDIEPASNTVTLGTGSIFKDCRFERMDFYALQGVYDRFPWFYIKGNYNKFINCIYGGVGENNSIVNPIFKVQGNFNEIELYNGLAYFEGIITLEDRAEGNKIINNSRFLDRAKVENFTSRITEGTTIYLNSQTNKIIYNDVLTGNSVANFDSYTKAEGVFKSYCGHNTDLLLNISKWALEGLEANTTEDYPLSVEDAKNFILLKLTNVSSNKRFYKTPTECLIAPYDGVYTLTITLKNKSSSNIRIGCYLNPSTEIKVKNRWVTVQSKMFFKRGDEIIPTIQFIDGVLNDEILIGNINVCEGENSVYFENPNKSILKKVF